jgi:hypothetical protein
MPVIKCSNGKYRIGTGACIFDTEEKAQSVWAAIRVSMVDSYNDYPEAAKANAKRALNIKKENDRGCGTLVGWTRANQIAKGENISRETIARMSSFERHRENSKGDPKNDCGALMWLAWGGDEGVSWAQRKLAEIDKQKFAVGVPHYTIDGVLWTGETHKDASGRLMTGAVHTKDSEYLYHKEDLAEVGERGGIKGSPKAPKSDTKNPDPKGEGSAKGDAGGKRGAEVSKDVEEALQKKADDFNERYKEKLGYGANLGALKSVYQRGLGAYNTSRSPYVKSAKQWAYARVNAFLYLIKNGRPENPKYDSDFDLLPTKHPKYPK